MASKGIIRSIRISDEMAELIGQQVGKNFTEKWENLVTKCIWEQTQKEEQLQEIQAKINRENQRLQDMQRATEQLRMLEGDLATARRYFRIVECRAKYIAETTEKEDNQ